MRSGVETYISDVSSCVRVWASIRACLVMSDRTVDWVYKLTIHGMYIRAKAGLQVRPVIRVISCYMVCKIIDNGDIRVLLRKSNYIRRGWAEDIGHDLVPPLSSTIDRCINIESGICNTLFGSVDGCPGRNVVPEKRNLVLIFSGVRWIYHKFDCFVLRKWTISLPRIVPQIWFVCPLGIVARCEVKELGEGSIGFRQNVHSGWYL